jgi:hypothetical protein
MPEQTSAYGDTDDRVMLILGEALLDAFVEFETRAFADLAARLGPRTNTAVVVGAGRRVSESERPFLSRFDQAYLLEPDPDRRAALRASLSDSRFEVRGDPVEMLPQAGLPAPDVVLCKYVLQHLPTHALPAATAALRGAAGAAGEIAIFTSASDSDDYFRIAYRAEHAAHVAEALGRPLTSSIITEEEFNRLLTQPPRVPLIVTHHFSADSWARLFPGMKVRLQMGPAETAFVSLSAQD